MTKRHNFKELKVWQYARSLVKEIYTATFSFPKDEMYALTQQIRRATVSIAANIAEGCGRGTNAQLAHFLDISQGSAYEVETLLILSADLGYINQVEYNDLVTKLTEIQRMLDGFKYKIIQMEDKKI
jgi:four helix bundle protein